MTIRDVFPTRDMKLDQFTEQLQKSRAAFDAHGPWHEPEDRSPAMLKMSSLRDQLLARSASQGMSWDLLKLEWRYDLALLMSDFKHWMRYVDEQFSVSNWRR